MEAFNSGLDGDPGGAGDPSGGGAGRLAGGGGWAGGAGVGGSGGTVATGGEGEAGAPASKGGTDGLGGTTGAAGAIGGSSGAIGSGGGSGGVGGGTGGAKAGGGGGGGSGGAGEVVLSVDFVGMGDSKMAATEIAGVKAAMNWNSAAQMSGTLNHLLAADGSQTTASVTWSADGEFANMYPDNPGDARMMNGYLDPTSSAATVTVTGLPSSITAAGYDVYLYTTGYISTALTRTYGYSIGSASVSISQTGPPAANFPGYTLATDGGSGNYVVFHELTGGSFTLKATPGTGLQTRAPVNGLQIVSPPGT
jgi:hypothetical protein